MCFKCFFLGVYVCDSFFLALAGRDAWGQKFLQMGKSLMINNEEKPGYFKYNKVHFGMCCGVGGDDNN